MQNKHRCKPSFHASIMQKCVTLYTSLSYIKLRTYWTHCSSRVLYKAMNSVMNSWPAVILGDYALRWGWGKPNVLRTDAIFNSLLSANLTTYRWSTVWFLIAFSTLTSLLHVYLLCLFFDWKSRSASSSTVGAVSVCRLHICHPGVTAAGHRVCHQPLPPVPTKLCITVHPQCPHMWAQPLVLC